MMSGRYNCLVCTPLRLLICSLSLSLLELRFSKVQYAGMTMSLYDSLIFVRECKALEFT